MTSSNKINYSNVYAPYEGTVKGATPITIEDAARYIIGWDKWEQLFSQKTLKSIIPTILCRDVIGVHYVPANKDYHGNYTPITEGFYEKNCAREELIPSMTFEERKGEWTRKLSFPAIGYRVPYQYQSVRLNKVFKDALLTEYPYLKGYNFAAYAPNYGDLEHEEIYVKMNYIDEEGNNKTTSLYVPIIALKKKDASLIYNRHYNYHSNYWKGALNYTDEKYNKWIKENIPVLHSVEYRKFAEIVEKGGE